MKDVVGYEGLYAIDEEGNVFSLRTHKKMKAYKLKNRGYMLIGLSKNKKNKKHLVHRLMAETYLPEFSPELQVDHIDRDRTNNSIDNLRMVTAEQNAYNRGNVKGYYWQKKASKWMAYIDADKKRTYLGLHTCPLLARVAYLSAKRSLHTFTYDPADRSLSHKNGE
jgi:hypothetical protein